MKISFNWIKEYLTHTEITPKELVEKIKQHLSDIEDVEDLAKKYQDLIVGEITKKKEHPNADKLEIYEVKISSEKQVQVVAGDKNLEVGDKVIYLPPKSRVPHNAYPDRFDGIIEKTKLRGIESNGMLASEKELGFSSEHDSVLKLELNCKAGDNVTKLLNLDDHIIDVENKTLTIRPDTFGTIGISRDISGFLGLPFKTPEWFKQAKDFVELKEEKLPLTVVNKLKKLCPRYIAISMSDIKIGPSPLWLKIRLSSLGIKPINNVVDITNYLMLLTGQPLHAFDYDKVIAKDIHYKNKATITVRTARQGEKITTIDGKTRELNENTVVICDSQNPIAIGGIMGGLETEIDENTKNIIIESANFDLYNIRKTSMGIGLVTDAVTRFSKGQDPNICKPVLDKAVEMIEEICSGKVASKIQDHHIELPKPHLLTFSLEYFQKHTGLNLSKETILNILSNIEIKIINSKDENLITLEIPTYRQDLKIAEDIHEEIARLHGYTNIGRTLPKRDISSTPSNKDMDFDKKIRTILKSIGCNELLTYNFVSEKLYANCDLDISNNYKITNALSPELGYMRSSLIPSLLEKINININNGYEEFCLFEINKIHNKLDYLKKEELPKETKVLSMVFTKNTDKNIYYNIKHSLELLLKETQAKEIKYEYLNQIDIKILPNHIKILKPLFDINSSGVLSFEINKKKIFLGIVGQPNLDVAKKLKLLQPVGLLELDIEKLKKISGYNDGRINFSKYPKIIQDLCFVINKDIPYVVLKENIKEILEKRNLNFILTPVDIYQEDETAQERQITIRVLLQHKEKTLKEKDIHSIRDIIEKTISKKIRGKLKT